MLRAFVAFVLSAISIVGGHLYNRRLKDARLGSNEPCPRGETAAAREHSPGSSKSCR